jgi:threonine/homoserine/homoserine lactone efflux protein
VLNTLFLFLFTSLTLTLFPGPDILLVISTSVQRGWRSGFELSLGLTSGILIHTLVLVLGVGSLLAIYPQVIRLIELMGAAYLIYLGVMSWRVKSTDSMSTNKKITQNLFVTGLIMNISNPKVSLFFLSFFPVFLFHDSWSYAVQFLILGVLFFIQAVFVFFSCSLFFHRLGQKIQVSKSFDHWDKVQAVLFFVIALVLIYP